MLKVNTFIILPFHLLSSRHFIFRLHTCILLLPRLFIFRLHFCELLSSYIFSFLSSFLFDLLSFRLFHASVSVLIFPIVRLFHFYSSSVFFVFMLLLCSSDLLNRATLVSMFCLYSSPLSFRQCNSVLLLDASSLLFRSFQSCDSASLRENFFHKTGPGAAMMRRTRRIVGHIRNRIKLPRCIIRFLLFRSS